MNGFVLGTVPGTRTSLAVTKVDRASPVTFTVTPADDERELMGTAVSVKTKAWSATSAKVQRPTKSKLPRARVQVKLKDASTAVPTGKVVIQARAAGKKKWRKVATASFTRRHAGKRAITLRRLPKGSYWVRVTYAGNGTFDKSRSKPIRLRLRR